MIREQELTKLTAQQSEFRAALAAVQRRQQPLLTDN